MEQTAFVPIGTPRTDRPRCVACGSFLAAPPEGETFRRRGAFAIVVEWRICRCGAFVRTQRVCREAPAGSA
jgi:hypothetical protein